MTRGSLTASPEPEPEAGRGQAGEEGQGEPVTVSEEPASMSPSPSSSNHSPAASPPRAPIALATSPSRSRTDEQASEGKREEEEEGGQQQQRTSSPPPSSSPVQEDGDQAEGGSASPLAASPTSEQADPYSTPKARGRSDAEPSETKPQEGRQEERPALGQRRQTSREYKETLDAKTKDEKDGTRMLNQYHLTRVIGQGAYGVVFEGRLREDASEIFAVKELSKTRLKKSRRSEQLRRPSAARGGLRGRGLQRGPSRGASSDKEEDKDPLELIRREIAIMKKLDHPNIISLHEVLDDPSRDELYMVVEYCPGGVVIDVKLHERTTPLKEDVARSYFVQILLGIEYLHSSDIVHRDIKPANILLAEDGKTCKIVDFGVSELFAPSEKPADAVSTARGQGTPAFLSPEICSARAPSSRQSTGERRSSAGEGAGLEKPGAKSERETSGYRDDLWAFGVTLYCMVVGHLPFDKSGFMDLYEAICHEEPEYPSHLSQECVDLLQKFLMKDPEKRITIEDAREHQWVTLAGTAPIPSAAKNLSAVVSEITEDELRKAIRRVSGVFAVARAVTKFKRRKSTARSVSGSANGEGGQSSNDRQGSMLWSSSSSNPSSPHVQQGTYDSPQASPSVSRAETMISSLTGGESGLGLTSAINNLKSLTIGGGQGEKTDQGPQASSDDPKDSSDGTKTDSDSKEPEQSTTSLLSPMAWARSAGLSSSSLRSGATSLPSAINTAACAGAKTLGLGTIAEVNTPASPESRSGWPSSKEKGEEPAQQTSKNEPGSVGAEEEQQGSDSPTKVESPSGEETQGDPCEEPADRRQDQKERLHASLQALEARFEARMRQSDPTAATKHLSNRLQQAVPLDRLSAGLKGFGLDTIAAALANITGQDVQQAGSDDADGKGGKDDGDQNREDSGGEESEERHSLHRPESLIEPDHLKEDEEGHNVHTGRKTSRGTASSGVKVDRFSEQQEHWARAQARGGDSSSGGTERPHLFDGPVVESPVREEVPMDKAVETLSALIPDGLDAQDQKIGEEIESGGGGSGSSKGSGDYFTSSLGPKSTAAAKQRKGEGQRQDRDRDGQEGLLPSACASPGAIDPHSGRIDGDVQTEEGGEKHHIERPAVGEPSAEEKHKPPVEPRSESGGGGGGGSKVDAGRTAASPEMLKEKEGAGADTGADATRDTHADKQADKQADTRTHADKDAHAAGVGADGEAGAGGVARPVRTEDSLPALGFGDEKAEGQEGGSRDRKKGGQGAALL